jgi:hypothetical protein
LYYVLLSFWFYCLVNPGNSSSYWKLFWLVQMLKSFLKV